jgi:hypothetical protein
MQTLRYTQAYAIQQWVLEDIGRCYLLYLATRESLGLNNSGTEEACIVFYLFIYLCLLGAGQVGF